MPITETVERLPNQGWDERIQVYRNGALVQVFVAATARFVVLVDTLINPRTAKAIMDQVQPLLAGRQLLVVNTHADFDHAWGNQLFAGPGAPYPAPILAHHRCAQEFDHPDAPAYLAQMQTEQPAIFGPVRLVKPTLTFDQELVIDGGDLTLRLFPAFGHTPDHIAIFIPEIATLLAGDAAELPYPAARSVAGLPEMRATLARLAALEAQTVLYCHAPPTIGPKLIQDNIAYFDALEAACRATLARDPTFDPDGVDDLAAAVGCTYAGVTPRGGAWDEVHPDYRGALHEAQVRMMLAWLRGEQAA
ncbi:MAG TPA: MBL fold metallo-hydrolase [Caldilineaceae bacterium]|nr:MBL fold metallo-hydrolase [Caldilineaceae bacterium]